ncbi:hypothetical protein ABID56_001338 [Alkalibacillus flavidus]|uniref:Uncharacterized protein n=1 Tax=Alkalibacillus flavidus TaxID=546021 RepID=A0ABV2KUK7_9BACI
MAQLSLLNTAEMCYFTQHQKYINGVLKTKAELSSLFEAEGKDTNQWKDSIHTKYIA